MGNLKGDKKVVLGRGLSALFDQETSPSVVSIKIPHVQKEMPLVKMIPVKNIAPGESQPRKKFNDVTLIELSQSIMQDGLLQPIVVQRVKGEVVSGFSEEVNYRILAGERRWRACTYLGWKEIPAFVQEVTAEEALSISLIENIQREDISPLEEAEGYKRLLEEAGFTQEALASRVGKSRSHIANLLRLNGLPTSLKERLQENQLSVGHVRALLTVDNPEEIARQVIKRGLSVRQTEALIQRAKGRNNEPPVARFKKQKNPETIEGSVLESVAHDVKSEDVMCLEEDIKSRLGREVTIRINEETHHGSISFQFKGMTDLDDFLNQLTYGHSE